MPTGTSRSACPLRRRIGDRDVLARRLRTAAGLNALDGFDVLASLVHAFDRPRESLRSIELYTDGYFKPAATPDVAAWEAAFVDVERADPEKIDAYPSVKGTVGRTRTDDRTIVIVEL